MSKSKSKKPRRRSAPPAQLSNATIIYHDLAFDLGAMAETSFTSADLAAGLFKCGRVSLGAYR